MNFTKKADNAAARSETYLWCSIQKFQFYFSNKKRLFIFTLSSLTNKRPELFITFFSITNCFTSLRNLQYSVHNLLSSLCRNLLYTSHFCLMLPLISSSHNLVDLPKTTVFSPAQERLRLRLRPRCRCVCPGSH